MRAHRGRAAACRLRARARPRKYLGYASRPVRFRRRGLRPHGTRRARNPRRDARQPRASSPAARGARAPARPARPRDGAIRQRVPARDRRGEGKGRRCRGRRRRWPLRPQRLELAALPAARGICARAPLAHRRGQSFPRRGARYRARPRRIAPSARAGARFPPAPTLAKALERDIAESHCGEPPPPKLLAGMVEAQRARDARMAALLRAPSVLITGVGHARRDRGVPLYLPAKEVLSIAFVEVQPGKRAAQDYFEGFFGPGSFDYVWFTPRAERADPCAR